MSSLVFELIEQNKRRLEDKLFYITDDYEIYCHFIGFDVELGETANSPLRDNDECSSFGIFEPTRFIPERLETLLWKDLGTGDGGDVFKFCRRYASHWYNEELKSKYETIKFIDREMNLGLFDNSGEVREKVVRKSIPKRDTSIYYKSRPFTKFDLEYWATYGITQEILEKYKVKSVRYLLDEEGHVRKEFRLRELAFVYEIWDKLKLYRPKEKREFKFRNTCPGNDPQYYQGYEQIIVKGVDTLVITKSLKDIMCFDSLFMELGYSVDLLAPHAESINLDPEFVVNIKKQYKRIVVVSDFDLAGVKFANKCRKMGLEVKFVSTNRQLVNGKMKVIDKDISDYHEIQGRFKTKKLIKKWTL